MTLSIRKPMQSPLELNYTAMKKSSIGENQNTARKVTSGLAISSLPEDSVTLSSAQSDSNTLPKIKKSQPVTTVEKQALQIQFSVYA
ncbi:MAG: hypothetical protein HIU83_09645 [Proteobacteria bacterium]|nr:hypothetical protein [Pseudomonadota bacterium]